MLERTHLPLIALALLELIACRHTATEAATLAKHLPMFHWRCTNCSGEALASWHEDMSNVHARKYTHVNRALSTPVLAPALWNWCVCKVGTAWSCTTLQVPIVPQCRGSRCGSEALSVGIATTIAFGGCSFCVLRTTGLVLLCNAVTVLPQPFSVDQILHGLMEETVRLLMGLFGCTIKNLNVVFQQLTRTDLSKKDIPQHGIFRSCSHTCEGSIPLVDESSQVLDSSRLLSQHPKDLQLCKDYLLLRMF